MNKNPQEIKKIIAHGYSFTQALFTLISATEKEWNLILQDSMIKLFSDMFSDKLKPLRKSEKKTTTENESEPAIPSEIDFSALKAFLKSYTKIMENLEIKRTSGNKLIFGLTDDGKELFMERLHQL